MRTFIKYNAWSWACTEAGWLTGRQRPPEFIVYAGAFCYAPRNMRAVRACLSCAQEDEQGSMGQDIFDLIIILILVFFAGRGFINGFVGEVAGVVSLLGGFWLANVYHPQLAPRLEFIADPSWRAILAYVLIFFGVVIVVAIIARILQKILSFAFVSWADKLAGAVLGLTKGFVLCTLALIVLNKFFSNAAFMKNSRVLPYFDALIRQVRDWLPPDLLSRFGM